MEIFLLSYIALVMTCHMGFMLFQFHRMNKERKAITNALSANQAMTNAKVYKS